MEQKVQLYPDNLMEAIIERHQYPKAHPLDMDRKPPDFEGSLRYVLASLTPREQLAIYLRFEGYAKLSEVGRQLDVSAERARQILTKALAKLAHPSIYNKLRLGIEGYIIAETKARCAEGAKCRELGS